MIVHDRTSDTSDDVHRSSQHDRSTGRSSIISIYHDSIGRLNIDRSTSRSSLISIDHDSSIPLLPRYHKNTEWTTNTSTSRSIRYMHVWSTDCTLTQGAMKGIIVYHALSSCVELHLLRQTTIVTNRTGQTSCTLGQTGQSIQRSNRT